MPNINQEVAQRGFQGRQPQQPQGQAPNPEGMNTKMAELAQAMGMHPGFSEELEAEGTGAINRWVEDVDNDGSIAKIMRMTQKFGTWLEDRMTRGRPPSRAEIEEAMIKVSEEFDVPPELGQQLLTQALQKMQGALGELQGQGQAQAQGAQPQPQPQPRQGGMA